MRGPLGAAMAVLLSATSCVADRAADGSTATIEAPVRRFTPTAMLRQLDLDAPADLELSASDRAAPVPAAAPAFNALSLAQSPDDASRALDCLTQAVYYEAGNQSDDGERAVAQVVLNRVRDRAFPSSVCGVVYQGSNRSTGCQFSFTCDGSLRRQPSASGWNRARAIAAAALNGDVYAPVGSSTFYHADYVSPWWATAMDRVIQIGAHIFYRWRGGMENALSFRQRYSGNETIPTPHLAGTMASGVTVNYGVQQAAGSVMVHHGDALVVASAPAVASAGAKPATVPSQAVMRTPRTMVAGVRIHRGASATASGEDLSDRATID